VEDKKDG